MLLKVWDEYKDKLPPPLFFFSFLTVKRSLNKKRAVSDVSLNLPFFSERTKTLNVLPRQDWVIIVPDLITLDGLQNFASFLSVLSKLEKKKKKEALHRYRLYLPIRRERWEWIDCAQEKW